LTNEDVLYKYGIIMHYLSIVINRLNRFFLGAIIFINSFFSAETHIALQ